jgi:hypothetical protein
VRLASVYVMVEGGGLQPSPWGGRASVSALPFGGLPRKSIPTGGFAAQGKSPLRAGDDESLPKGDVPPFPLGGLPHLDERELVMVYEMIVNVDKAELLGVLRVNRGKHRAVFLAALSGYREEAIRVLDEQIKMIEAGKSPAINLRLDRPEDHTKDYDRVIGMLEMDQSDVFRLDSATYSRYVDDDWTWKRQWAKLSSSYADQLYTQNYGAVDEGDDGY